jgi:HlyD family secretion protein
MKKLIFIFFAIMIVSVSVWYLGFAGKASENDQYSFVEVYRGDLENSVSSTGTLSAVGTVEIGTQVSGIIDKVLVDFNDSVRKGQILAVLDTIVLASAVRDAEAGVLKAEAQLELSESDFERDRKLFEKDMISQQALTVSKTELAMNRASLQIAEAALDRAERNLQNAVIRSPIDGTVIYRSVEPGQTVAASLSTPTLFIIAEDLGKMEIHAYVDESDIGQIKQGLPVRFTVEAYLDSTFSGTVRQIWLQPQTISNVVNYTVVVDALNENGLLLPGMTATLEFILDQKKDVLLVKNAALKLQPTQDMLVALQKGRTARSAPQGDLSENQDPDSVDTRPRSADSRGEPASSGVGRASGVALLWYLDEAGTIKASRVRTGSTDDRVTEITGGDDIREGLQVISAVSGGSSGNKSSSSSTSRPPLRRIF